MENNRLSPLVASLVVCLLFTNCATTHEPGGWLPDETKAPADPYGAWIEVNTKAGRLMGELIAVSQDTLFVANSTLHTVDNTAVQSARVAYFDASGLWAAPLVGPLLTISNGYYLVFTAPMWIIGGAIAASSRSYEPIVDYPQTPLRDFARYARFPQGIPQDLDRSTVRMKEVKK